MDTLHDHECRECGAVFTCRGREVNGACELFEGMCLDCE